MTEKPTSTNNLQNDNEKSSNELEQAYLDNLEILKGNNIAKESPETESYESISAGESEDSQIFSSSIGSAQNILELNNPTAEDEDTNFSESESEVYKPAESSFDLTETNESKTRKPNKALRAGAAGIALGLAVGAGGLVAVDAANGGHGASSVSENIKDNLSPVSDKKNLYTVMPGDTLWDIAKEEVEGSDKVATDKIVESIVNDPANIEVLKNDLHPGEQIFVPESTKRYEEENK